MTAKIASSREPSGAPAPLGGVEDVQLVAAARQGDGIAMAELMDRLLPLVGRICGAVALEHGADATQETMVQVLRDLPQLRDPQRLRAWVRRIASREAVRVAKRARRDVPLEDLGVDLPGPDDSELRASVRDLLAKLSPEQRAILVLRDLEGLSEAEAAEQLGVERGTVKSRLHRARAAFGQRWKP